jgi:hypothetical protein
MLVAAKGTSNLVKNIIFLRYGNTNNNGKGHGKEELLGTEEVRTRGGRTEGERTRGLSGGNKLQ